MSLLSIISASGWPMWPLILASMASLALVVERFISLGTSRVVPPKLLDEALLASKSGVPGADVVKHLEGSSVFGSVLASGLRALHQNPSASEADVRSALEGAGRLAAHQLERFLPALATLASVAPLMGLFGTVIGMIEIFGAQSATGATNPVVMANGIALALYATAFGLVIAIPSLLFWRYFRSRVDGYLLQMEAGTELFARHLARFCKS